MNVYTTYTRPLSVRAQYSLYCLLTVFLLYNLGADLTENSSVKVKVTLRLTVGQSVSFCVESHLGLMTRYWLLFDSYGLVFVGRPLWREDGSVFCICCWSSPAQSFSGPNPLDLATIFYCLSFETSLFVASYDSQDHGGGIRPRLHTGHWQRKRHSIPL
jgi:hypothetical protein